MIVYYLKNTSLNKEEDHNNSEQTRKNGFDGTGERERASQRFNTIPFIAENLAKGRIET
jgi:hypothetical protein